MPEEFDPWALSTGLQESMSGPITDAYYSYDNSYNNGATCVLKLVVQDRTVGEQTLLYPCGDNWEPFENGSKVRHNSGQPKNFGNQSGVGLLVRSAVDAGLRDELSAKGDPFSADMWKGFDLQFHNTEFEYTDRKTKEPRSYSRMLIVGVGDSDGEDEAPAKKPAAKSAAKSAPPKDTGVDLSAIDPVLRGKLKAVAASTDTHDAFLEAAFTADNFEIPAELEVLAVTAEFYTALRG